MNAHAVALRSTTPGARRAPRARRSPGLTLVEVVVSTVLIGVMMVAALSTVAVSRRTHDTVNQRQRGMLLAEALLSEIAAQPYEDAADAGGKRGPTAGEASTGNRSLFNDLNDYDGWTASPPQRKDGTPVPQTVGWRETVTLELLDPGTLAKSGTDQGLTRVTVAVTQDGALVAELTLLRSRGSAACEACCLPRDVCRMLPPEECKLYGGSPSGAGTTCWTHTCNASLVAYWKLNESSGLVANDSVLSHQGILVNGPTWTTSGKIGNALQFDGTNDYVEISHQADLSLAGQVSITAWIYKSSNGGTDIILHKGATTTSFSLQTKSSKLEFTIVDSKVWNCTGSFTLALNTWYHVAATYDDSTDTVKLYLNGALRDTIACAGVMTPNSEALYLGRDTSMSSMYAGRLDEVRLYNKALSDSEVLAIYSGTAPP